MFYIYYLTSEVDNYNPRYVGYTTNLEKRLKEHLKGRNYEKSSNICEKNYAIIKFSKC